MVTFCIFGSLMGKLCWSDNCSLAKKHIASLKASSVSIRITARSDWTRSFVQGAYVIRGTILFAFPGEKCRSGVPSGSGWFSGHNGKRFDWNIRNAFEQTHMRKSALTEVSSDKLPSHWTQLVWKLYRAFYSEIRRDTHIKTLAVDIINTGD